MDIRIDAGFHHKNPNVYIPPLCINNSNNQYNPKYMSLTLFNLSKVDHLYIGKDTLIAFADESTVDTYNIELASEDKIKEHLAKPHNWVPQRHKTLPEIPHDKLLLFVHQQMYQDHARCNCRIKPSPQILSRNLRSYVKNMERPSPRTMRTSTEQSLSKWTLTQKTAHL